jgi:dienelactone hydrolase
MLTRRELLQGGALTLATSAFLRSETVSDANPLPGTQPLTWEGSFPERVMNGAHRYVEQKIAESIKTRQKYWDRDLSSRAAYEKSVEPNRGRFLKQIGVVDARLPVIMERFGDDDNPSLVAETDAYSVHQVRWPTLAHVTGLANVYGEGLLLEPRHSPVGYVIALPDADQTPEQISGLAPGIAAESQYARRLAESGFEVVVPVLIDRTSCWSGHPDIQMTNESGREWIYRQAYHMGRHIIGYEVQKVLAAVDWFCRKRGEGAGKIGVVGYVEGGLIGFYAAAADTRIDAALVSGYFNTRQHVWSEPLCRNVWALLHEFGDAEIATLIAPRGLVVEYSLGPEISGLRGDLRNPKFQTVEAEFDRIASLIGADFQPRQLVRGEGDTPVEFGSEKALQQFVRQLGANVQIRSSSQPPEDRRRSFDPAERQRKQLRALEAFTQELVRESEHVRRKFYLYKVAPEMEETAWIQELNHPTYSPDKFIEASKWYRQYFWEEILGKFEEPLLPANPRTRRIYDNPKWVGYEVVLDVWPEVSAWGILLLPKDMKPGERRPVVVCQHGLDSVPKDVIEETRGYHKFAARLADQGFIIFAPFNLYWGDTRYRWLCRKANGVKASLFSFILGQHDQILRWLQALPMVDPSRIGFYGISYGGETAVRVPPILEGYCLSICSGDFNSWTRKVAATDERFSYMYNKDQDSWEMPYFNEGSTFDYSEMTYLMALRPFMVERGRWDLTGRDRWVAYEYAKVARLYTQFGRAGDTAIQFFNGGHTIYGHGTFRFLHKHLDWPELKI